MAITYIKQREDINADPSPSIVDLSKQWPFLLSWKFLLSHFTILTGVELHSRMNEVFRGQLMKWSREVKAVLKEALKED